MASRSKQDATSYIYKKLELHTAYERAKDNVRPFINGATTNLDDDLEKLFDELAASKSTKTDTKPVPNTESVDVEMKTD